MNHLRGIAAAAILAAVSAVTVQCAPSSSAPAPESKSQTSAVSPEPWSPPPATVHPVTAAELGTTWRPECPVGPESLRRIDIEYLDFNGGTQRGQLVVNKDVADDVIAIFDDLRRIRYPIEKMQTVDHYPGAEDELSMRDNNTSAFNCRPLPGSAAWSLHAYGRAIDINPLVNPYVDAEGDLQPSTAGRYLDRSRDDLGLLHDGDAAVRVFTDRGWRWGGDWRNPIDYQHFERP